ncbi:MAG TPA: LTA synthase family protein [Flavobacteriales bacterium]
MKAFWRWLLLLALWWMLVFLVQRLLFLAAAMGKLEGIAWSGILLANGKALPMDLSATGYLLLLPVVLMLVAVLSGRAVFAHVSRILVVVFLVLAAVINVVDIGLFDAWGTKVVRKALGYLAYPKEVIGIVRPIHAAALIALAGVQVFLFERLLRRIDFRLHRFHGSAYKAGLAMLVAPALCVLAARGGPQDLPIDKSWSYFSRHPVLNLAALNGVWNTLEIAVQPAEFETQPYAFMPQAEAEAVMHAGARRVPSQHRSILRVERPNILMVFLESWTADIIEPLGGDSGVAPEFTALCQEGLLFHDFYSTGFRTEQGLCAMISGFPSQPTTTIIRKYGKFDRLPSLVRRADSAGYHATYWYAGDVAFANTRAYLEAMGFDRVHDENSFPIRQRTRWGAYDEELFDFHLKEARKDPEPFFHVVMTSTSHEPFDAPVEEGFRGGEPQRYRNTVHYTDRMLGRFLRKAKNEPWYDRTLIVVVADHGHYLPHNRQHHSAARHRIPFLITGGALDPQFRGKVERTVGCHVDLPVTLLAQLGLSTDGFEWGRDLFDSAATHRAFWTFDEGFGTADSVQTVVYDALGKRIIELRDSTRMNDRDRLLHEGQARLQVLLDRYIEFDQ